MRTLPIILSRLLMVLISLTLISCAQGQQLGLNSEWPSLSSLWSSDKEADQLQQDELASLIEADIKVSVKATSSTAYKLKTQTSHQI